MQCFKKVKFLHIDAKFKETKLISKLKKKILS